MEIHLKKVVWKRIKKAFRPSFYSSKRTRQQPYFPEILGNKRVDFRKTEASATRKKPLLYSNSFSKMSKAVFTSSWP